MLSLVVGLAFALVPRCAPPHMMANTGMDRLRAMAARDREPKPEIAMPAVLAAWGCDEDLWSKVRSKAALVKMANEGAEAAARERIEMLRNAPSVTGAEPAMPSELVDLGCDEELWSKVRSKTALCKLVQSGDLEGAKSRLAIIRASAPAVGGQAFERRKAKREARNAGGAKPLSEGYTLKGTLPASVDTAAVAALVAKRVDAKLSKDYDAADALQLELLGMGVEVNDRARTYYNPRK